MKRIVSINKRGSLTLPKDLRAKYGLEGEAQVVIEESPQGLLIRPSATFPVEIYSPQRLEEFHQSNEEELKGFELG